MALTYNFPQKPHTPVFRPDYPGANRCRVCFPFSKSEMYSDSVVNLAAAYYPEVQSPTIGALGSVTTWGIDKCGPALQTIFDETSSSEISLGAMDDFTNSTTQQTVVVAFRKRTAGTEQAWLWQPTRTPNSSWHGLRQGSLDRGQHLLYWGADYYLYDYIDEGFGGPIDTWDLNLWVFVIGQSRGGEMWHNGVLGFSDATTYTRTELSTQNANLFGAYGDTDDWNVAYFATFDYEFSKQEVMNVFDDPWGMITAPKLIWDIGMSIAGGETYYIPNKTRLYRNRRV